MTPDRRSIAQARAEMRETERRLLKVLHGDPAPPLEEMEFDEGWQGYLDRADTLWRAGRPLEALAVWTEVRRQGGCSHGRS